MASEKPQPEENHAETAPSHSTFTSIEKQSGSRKHGKSTRKQNGSGASLQSGEKWNQTSHQNEQSQPDIVISGNRRHIKFDPEVIRREETKSERQALEMESSEGERLIKQLTIQANSDANAGRLHRALPAFQEAYEHAGKLSEPAVRVACAFNLGAAHVAMGEAAKGLPLLLQARLQGMDITDVAWLPMSFCVFLYYYYLWIYEILLAGWRRGTRPWEELGGRRGDLLYNLGAAYDGLKDYEKAAECYEQASREYHSDQLHGQADAKLNLGHCYLHTGKLVKAASCFQVAGKNYQEVHRPDLAAEALLEAAEALLRCPGVRPAQTAAILDECRNACSRIEGKRGLLGRLYNDLGLNYSRLGLFPLAADCFKQALPLCSDDGGKGSGGGNTREAVAKQNLGAVYNSMGQFHRAVPLHRQAAALHGKKRNRGAQGQCFSNLGFACSQLSEHAEAADSYLHALQAFRDSGDVQGQWQASEGLAASKFKLGEMESAVQNYKQTLALLARCQVLVQVHEAPEVARERVVAKLSDALQHSLSCFVHTSPKQPSMLPVTFHHTNGAYHRDERQQGVWFRRGQRSQKRERSLQVPPRDQRLQQDRSSSTDDESSDIANPCTSARSRNCHDKSQIVNADSAPRGCGNNPLDLHEPASRQQGPAPHTSRLQPTAQSSRNSQAQRQMTRKGWHVESEQDASRRLSCSTATVNQRNRERTGQVWARSKLCLVM
uniref:tetratricopeptide repeat protein 24 n=1 Tax=Myxine glutinosa TaxID=7769 RepID=UPI00358F360B